jgi:hypothetical protein
MHGGRLVRREKRDELNTDSYADTYRELVGGAT